MTMLPAVSDKSQSAAEPRLFTVRGLTVVLDADLAALYGVTTGNFNKAVARNLQRFPEDFTFILEKEEFQALIFQIGTSKGRGGRRKLPRVFTEHGALRREEWPLGGRVLGTFLAVIRNARTASSGISIMSAIQPRITPAQQIKQTI